MHNTVAFFSCFANGLNAFRKQKVFVNNDTLIVNQIAKILLRINTIQNLPILFTLNRCAVGSSFPDTNSIVLLGYPLQLRLMSLKLYVTLCYTWRELFQNLPQKGQ